MTNPDFDMVKTFKQFLTEQEMSLFYVVRGNMQREYEAASHGQAAVIFHEENPNVKGELRVANSEKEVKEFFIDDEGKMTNVEKFEKK